MKSLRLAAFAVFALLLAVPAFAASKGNTLVGLELTNGTANLYSIYNSHYLTAYDHSELGVQAQVWHLLTDDYALNVSGNLGFFSETDKPGNAAPAGSTDGKYTQSSYSVRVGFDRVGELGHNASFFFGPGIEYWSGKAKFEGGEFAGSDNTYETQSVGRISLSGRIGAIMKLNDAVAASIQIGRKVGMASATDAGRKVSSWPSSFDAACGLVFHL
jgi:hypothetical protein